MLTLLHLFTRYALKKKTDGKVNFVLPTGAMGNIAGKSTAAFFLTK